MKVLITGANGFLANYLAEKLLTANYTVIATGRGDCRIPLQGHSNFMYEPMDFTDTVAVQAIFHKHKPDITVHAGAMSKPDECELNKELTWQINTASTIDLLTNASSCRSFFVFVSTDFVFDGERGMYTEDDLPAPVNYYGYSKLAAEEAVKKYEYGWAIARTVLVYGKPGSGRNNILTIVRDKLEKGETYNVVDDQLRTPTYVEDLADGIISIIKKKATGIWHLSGEDILTPYEMAVITADFLQLDRSLIKRVTAADFSQPAKRPPKTGFIIDKAKKNLGYQPRSFKEGLGKTFE